MSASCGTNTKQLEKRLMDKSRWKYLKALQPSLGRYIHVSNGKPYKASAAKRNRRDLIKTFGRRQAIRLMKEIRKANTL